MKPIEIRSYGAELTVGVGQVSKRVVEMVIVRFRTREHGQLDFFLPPGDAEKLADQLWTAVEAMAKPAPEGEAV